MPILTADDVGDRHRYIARNRPEWRDGMDSIQNRGGPWACSTCTAASLLCYRCSVCGADLAGGDGHRQER